MWDLISPARDGTHASCIGSLEFQPLDLQGGPYNTIAVTLGRPNLVNEVNVMESQVFIRTVLAL